MSTGPSHCLHPGGVRVRPPGSLRRHHLAGLLQQHHEPHHLPALHEGLQASAGEAAALLLDLAPLRPQALAGALSVPPQLRGAQLGQRPAVAAGVGPRPAAGHRHRRRQPAGGRAGRCGTAPAAPKSGGAPGLKVGDVNVALR